MNLAVRSLGEGCLACPLSPLPQRTFAVPAPPDAVERHARLVAAPPAAQQLETKQGEVMGLDTSHDCWHGSYSSFGEFRSKVLAAADRRFGYRPDYEAHPQRAFYGWWDDDHPYTSILDVFFVHSDCEGYIFPQHIDELATVLDQLDVEGDHYPGRSWQMLLRQFTHGLRRAGDEWEVVVFR